MGGWGVVVNLLTVLIAGFPTVFNGFVHLEEVRLRLDRHQRGLERCGRARGAHPQRDVHGEQHAQPERKPALPPGFGGAASQVHPSDSRQIAISKLVHTG